MSHPKYSKIGNIEDRLVEECSELIQAVCKANRFGWTLCHPKTMKTNARQALEEIEDVERCIAEIKPKLQKLEADAGKDGGK